MFEELVSPALLALLLGSLYTLMAVGLTLSYAVTKVANFAHGEYITVGAYAALIAVNNFHLDLIMAASVAFLVTAAVALASDELVYKPLFRLHARPIHLLVASIGVSLVIRYTLSIFADVYNMLSLKMNILVHVVLIVGYGAITTLHLQVLPTVIAAVILLHLIFHYTKLGKAMRATASNFDLARTSGIDTVMVRRVTWVIAGGLAGVAGAFWAVYSPIQPETGWLALLRVFAASIIGGLVSFYGTIIGGYIIGFSENIGITLANQYLGVDTAYRPIIPFAVIVIVFLLKPKGLGGASLESLGILGRRKRQRGEPR